MHSILRAEYWRRLPIAVFVVVLSSIRSSESTSISIVDSTEAYPFIRNVDTPDRPIQWDSGYAIQLLSSCKLIRITRRGVRCIAASDNVIPGWVHAFTHNDEPEIQTSRYSCMPINNALCVMDNGRRFFPTDVVFVTDGSVSKCINGQHRMLVENGAVPPGNGSIRFTPNYTPDDTSLCDILDTNLDVIYDPVNNLVFTKQLSNSTWLYATMSFLILVVVVLSAEAVSQRSRTKLKHNIIAWVLLSATSLMMLARIDGRMHPFVTTNDRTFIVTSFVYIMISTVYWVSMGSSRVQDTDRGRTDAKTAMPTEAVPTEMPHSSESQRDGVNAMIGSIHFATCVIYGTADNTYVSSFFFIFLFRCLQKLHDAHTNPDEWTVYANTILLLDVTYTAMTFAFGVLPHFTANAETILYASAQYMVCDMIATNATVKHSATLLSCSTVPPAEQATPVPNKQDQPGPAGLPDTPPGLAYNPSVPTPTV
jgi:hypothetical protein